MFENPRAAMRPSHRRGSKFLLASLFLCSNHRPSEATVVSTDLRLFTEDHLLFWSAYECAMDAALQFFGPIDNLLRGGAPGDILSDCSSSAGDWNAHCENAGHELVEEQNEISLVAWVTKNLSINFPNREKEVLTLRPTRAHRERAHGTSTPSSVPSSDSNVAVAVSTRGGGRRGDTKYSLYQPGDGSETDPDGIPTRYIRMQEGNRERAAQALQETLKWRKEYDIDNILHAPHPNFDIVKEVFPHYFVGRDKTGGIVFLQRPALLDIDRAKKNGMVNQDLLMHYIYVNEYLWQVLEGDKPLGTMTSILDMTGLELRLLRKTDLVRFLKVFVSTMDNHYPQRAHKTLLLNCPRWFNTLYSILTPLLRESTRSKIEIHVNGKKQDEALKRLLTPEAVKSLPPGVWSSSKKSKKGGSDLEELGSPVVQSEMERDLRDYTLVRIKQSGKSMQIVV